MTALFLLTAFAVQGPADLKLPYEKAIPLQDDAISRLPKAHTRDLTGSIVADDGSAVFNCDGQVIRVKAEYPYLEERPLFFREWEPDSSPVTDPQRGWMTLQSGKLDSKKNTFKRTEAFSVLRADNQNEFWVSYNRGEKGEIANVLLDYSAPTVNKTLAKPTQGFVLPVADLSSDAILAAMSDGKKLSEYGLLNSALKSKLEFIPGISAFRYDSALDLVLCFTFSESGFPAYLMIRHLKSAERVTIERPAGALTVTALLPNGRIIATITNRIGDDEDDPKLGLYEFLPPYKEPRYLGPYRLVGSSRNGRWLAVQHRNLRKAWLLLTK